MSNWAKHIELSKTNRYSKGKKFLALSLHYNLDMGIVIRYLGKTIRKNIEISKTHSRY